MGLKDTWRDRVDGEDTVFADDINEVARGVIELEESESSVGLRFPAQPQLNIKLEEPVRIIELKTMPDGTPISQMNFTCANILVQNASTFMQPGNGKLVDFSVMLGNSSIYLDAPASFLNDENQLYWTCHFDLVNALALGQNAGAFSYLYSAQAMMSSHLFHLSALESIPYFYFKAGGDIPAGTNIKIWLK